MSNNWDFLHWVIEPDGNVNSYGTKFISPSNVKGSRLKFAKCHTNGEAMGKAKIVDWDHRHTGQNNQLNEILGWDHRVLTQHEAAQAIKISAPLYSK